MEAPETGERALSIGAYPLLVIFHLFPVHAPITLWLMDAPFGKFSWDSVLNLPAGMAWAVMECVSVSPSCRASSFEVADLTAGSFLRHAETACTAGFDLVAFLDPNRVLLGALLPPCAAVATVSGTETRASAPRRRPRRVHLQRAQRLAAGVSVCAAEAENRATLLGRFRTVGTWLLRQRCVSAYVCGDRS